MADKGNVTVALKESDYIHKVKLMLSDTSTYKKLNYNPLNDLRKTIKELVHNWNENSYFPKKYSVYSLSQTDTQLSKFYGLPKIHKPDVPLRPIISLINNSTYFISKIICTILNNSIRKLPFFVKNSLHVLNKLNGLLIPDDYILVSFDVTSLFTNISLERVVESIQRRYNTIRNFTNVPLDELIKAVKIIMNNTFFQFDNEYYQQVFGSPMRSPVSPPFVDMVMIDLKI